MGEFLIQARRDLGWTPQQVADLFSQKNAEKVKHWEATKYVGVPLCVMQCVAERFQLERARQALGRIREGARKGGAARTEKKKAASIMNGSLGGRKK